MNPEHQHTPFKKNTLWLLSSVILTTGLLLRFRAYFTFRTLWGDEAALALSLLETPAAALLHPLPAQAAPAGFLLISKGIVSLLGPWEWVLRLFPLMCGIALLFLAVRLSRKLLCPEAALLATFFLALNQPLIYYSSEFKPYGPDACVILILLLLAVRVSEKPVSSRILLFAVAAGAAPFFSYPAVFAGAGTGLLLLCYLYQTPGRRGLGLLAAALAFSAIVFLFYKMILLDPYRHRDYFINYWTSSYPLSSFSLKGLHDLFAWPFELAAFPGGQTFPGLSLLVAFIGLGLLLRTRKKEILLPVFAVLVGAVAAMLRLYPLSGRLAVWVTPVFLIFLAAGSVFLFQTLRTAGRWPAVLLTLFLVWGAAETPIRRLWKPDMPDNVNPALRYALLHRQPGERLYVYYGASPAVLYYERTRGSIPDILYGTPHREQVWKYDDEILELFKDSSLPVWILFTHVWGTNGINEEMYFNVQARRYAKQTDYFHAFAGSGAYRFSPLLQP